MQRFFIPGECFTGNTVVFPPEQAHQISQVLRLKPGHQVVALNQDVQDGKEYLVNLVVVKPGAVSGQVAGETMINTEPSVGLSLYIALTHREKFEWVLQKCTEIGVTRFVPLTCARSLVQSGIDFDRKMERWHKILREAAEQSGRAHIPSLLPVQRFDEAVKNAGNNHTVTLIAWEKETGQLFHLMSEKILPDRQNLAFPRIALFIGPEGGFTEQEVETATRAGITPISLGSRILRMETAAIVAATLVLYTTGDLG
jgi:16S rRNA (uracil1498-N3)-methyltransferase